MSNTDERTEFEKSVLDRIGWHKHEVRDALLLGLQARLSEDGNKADAELIGTVIGVVARQIEIIDKRDEWIQKYVDKAAEHRRTVRAKNAEIRKLQSELGKLKADGR